MMSAPTPFTPPVRASSSFMCIREPFVVVWVPRPYFWDRLPVRSTTLLSSTLMIELLPTPLCPTNAEVLSFSRAARSIIPSPVLALILSTW